MVIFECEADEKNHGYSSECSSKNMPYDLQSCRGGSVLVVWAVGGEVGNFKVLFNLENSITCNCCVYGPYYCTNCEYCADRLK